MEKGQQSTYKVSEDNFVHFDIVANYIALFFRRLPSRRRCTGFSSIQHTNARLSIGLVGPYAYDTK